MSATPAPNRTAELAALDHAHLWHPFTPMRQWCASDPLIIERGQGPFLFDTHGKRYIDGASSLWCNVHGHRHPHIDAAIRDQLDRIAHTTLLGLSSPPAIELAATLIRRVQRAFNRADIPGTARLASESQPPTPNPQPLSKVFYTDAGATALEVAFKMAVGYWHHTGRPEKRRFIGLSEAYHGDTAAAMSVGFSELFHKPFLSMLFQVTSFAHPDACRLPPGLGRLSGHVFPSQDPALAAALRDHCLADLKRILDAQAHQTAAIVIEPIMQGAAGMIPQPPGFLRGVAKLAHEYDVLLIADEVATGLGRTGTLFACEQELDPQEIEDGFRGPDILCLAKGITGGYLPLAATLATDRVYDAFCGEPHEKKTLYHGHTYTGNALAAAAAIASLQLFTDDLLAHIQQSAALIVDKLAVLADHPNVLDVRQRGLMVGIELCKSRPTAGQPAEPFDFSKRTAAQLCLSMREQGLIIRPLGDVMVLMPAPAMPHDVLSHMLDIVTATLRNWRFT